MIFIVFLFSFLLFFLSFFSKNKEYWTNTYSGWPGPIENGNGLYNIPALYGDPKYSAPYGYKPHPRSNLSYYQLKNFPGDTTL